MFIGIASNLMGTQRESSSSAGDAHPAAADVVSCAARVAESGRK